MDAATSLDVRIFCVDEPPALYYLYKKGADREFRLAFTLYKGAFHRAVNKGRPDLLALVNRGFMDLPTATRTAIDRKWLGAPLLSRTNLRLVSIVFIMLVALLVALGSVAMILRRRVAKATTELRHKVSLLESSERRLVEDITEREAIESSLSNSEERFRTAFRGSGMPKAILGIDGHILEVNDALCRLISFSADELVGEPWQRYGHPEEMEATAGQVADIEAGIRVSDVIETRILCRDGLELWCLVNATAIRDTEGILVHFLIEMQDISDRKGIESTLRLSEEKYRKLFQSSPDLLIVTTTDSTILEVNDSIERVSGYRPEEVLGRTTDELNLWVDKADRTRYRTLLQKKGFLYNFETKFRKRSGEIIDALEFGSSIPFDTGSLYLTVIQDISDRKRMEENLSEREKEFRDLTESSPLGIIVHQNGIIKYVNPSTIQIMRYRNTSDAIGEDILNLIHPDSRSLVIDRLNQLAWISMDQS